MKRLLMLVSMVILFTSCGGSYAVKEESAKTYKHYKNTIYLKVHWNYLRPEEGKIVAEGYVEPFDKRTGLHTVSLELVGMDADGKVVNFAAGRPVDDYIASPLDTAPFKIVMRLDGTEKSFGIRGSYYHYEAGSKPDFGAASLDYISLEADDTPK